MRHAKLRRYTIGRSRAILAISAAVALLDVVAGARADDAANGGAAFDQHELKAAVVPRALLETSATGDIWANGPGTKSSASTGAPASTSTT